MLIIWRSSEVRWEPDSIPLFENRFRPIEIVESDLAYSNLYPNRWAFSIKIKDFWNLWFIERNTNIAILQILYGYLNRIVFLNLVSNRMPEICGFEAIKWANPQAQTHPINLWLKLSITGIFRTDIYRFVYSICISEWHNFVQIQ